MGIVTGMVASNWKIQHKYGHHKLGQRITNYQSRWDFSKKGEMSKYKISSAIWYSIRTSFPVFYLPLFEAYKKGIVNNVKKPINYRYAFIEQSVFIIFVLTLFLVNPKITLFYLIPWYFLVYFITRYTDYLNHFSRGDGKFDSSNNSLRYWYNKLGCNFGYHSAHHYKPGAHWSQLPQIHEEIKHKLNNDQLKTYSWSGFLMPYHFYLCLKGNM
jgi:fatty acid desaturase